MHWLFYQGGKLSSVSWCCYSFVTVLVINYHSLHQRIALLIKGCSANAFLKLGWLTWRDALYQFIFILSVYFWIRRMVKHVRKSQQRHLLKNGGSNYFLKLGWPLHFSFAILFIHLSTRGPHMYRCHLSSSSHICTLILISNYLKLYLSGTWIFCL